VLKRSALKSFKGKDAIAIWKRHHDGSDERTPRQTLTEMHIFEHLQALSAEKISFSTSIVKRQ
jgi:hypothetical protein